MSRTVPRNTGQLTLDVLHIRPGPGESASAADMDDRLAQTKRVVESCENVYAGLARLCRGDRPAPGVLIVCIDGLAASEMEFFSLASQWRGAPDVYVYGDAHAASKLDEAVRLGATGPVTDAVMGALDQKPFDHGDDSGVAFAHAGSTLLEPPVTQPGPQAGDDTAPANIEPAPAPSAEVGSPDASDELAGSPRVPWQRYTEAPARKRPQIKQTPVVNAPPACDTAAAPDPPEPLLTAAELEALLGDDIAAIVPDRPHGAGPGTDKGMQR